MAHRQLHRARTAKWIKRAWFIKKILCFSWHSWKNLQYSSRKSSVWAQKIRSVCKITRQKSKPKTVMSLKVFNSWKQYAVLSPMKKLKEGLAVYWTALILNHSGCTTSSSATVSIQKTHDLNALISRDYAMSKLSVYCLVSTIPLPFRRSRYVNSVRIT